MKSDEVSGAVHLKIDLKQCKCECRLVINANAGLEIFLVGFLCNESVKLTTIFSFRCSSKKKLYCRLKSSFHIRLQ